ncbi:MAG TPA: hypothetical protein VEP66_22075 [Myxococcales bacterium]|nr:hypothetical protein [Myxococcales bacterium]
MRPFILLIALAIACGTSLPTPASDGGVGSGGSDAGNPSSSDAGTVTGADGGSGGSSDAGTTGGGSDAGTTGGGGNADGGSAAASDCDGLQFPSDAGPAPASHFIPVADSSGNDGCFAVGTTGTGTLALKMLAGRHSTLDFVGPSGQSLATLNTVGSTDIFGEQATFFDDVQLSAMYELRTFSDTGAVLPPVRRDISLLSEDPTGGAVGLGGTIVSMDSSLATRWTVPFPSKASWVALAVDRSGATLYAFEGSATFGANSIAAMWIDSHGTAGEVFQLVGPQAQSVFAQPTTLAQRVGSGFFVQVGSEWIGQIDSLSTSLSPPPAWLQSRANTSLHMVHGGTGYAVLPAPSATCAQDVEVVSPQGTICGTTRFTGASSGCTVRSAIIVGYDGTVIQRAPDPDPAHQQWFGPGTCYWHWWPGFFR